VVRRLIGSNEQGNAGLRPVRRSPGLGYTCREGGQGGEMHSSRRCFGCVLAERARIMLAGPGGKSPALHGRVGSYVSLEQAIAESADAYHQALLNEGKVRADGTGRSATWTRIPNTAPAE
jgi:hypothetical protein